MNAVFVNADGTTESRPVHELKSRVADFSRGIAWVHAGFASAVNDGPLVAVYWQVPWTSYSSLSPDKERERQVELFRRGAVPRPASDR